MTDSTGRTRSRRVDRGGLPPDDDLSAFGAQAREAFGEPGGTGNRAALASVPHPVAAAGEPGAPLQPEPAPIPAQPGYPPAAGEADDQTEDDELLAVPNTNLIRQATISVDADVERRFRQYQKREGRDGPEPGNGEVVFRALEACDGRYRDIVAARIPQPTGRRFGAAVPGRRIASESRPRTQINYRPTYGELAEIKRLSKKAGARSVSTFLGAVLDEFLPPLRRSHH